jgi:hypothetical protein
MLCGFKYQNLEHFKLVTVKKSKRSDFPWEFSDFSVTVSKFDEIGSDFSFSLLNFPLPPVEVRYICVYDYVIVHARAQIQKSRTEIKPKIRYYKDVPLDVFS